MAYEDVRLIGNLPKLGFSINRRRAAKVTMVNGRNRRSPNLQPQEFHAIIDQQDCTGDQFLPSRIRQSVVVIAGDHNLVPVGKLTKPGIEVLNRHGRKTVAGYVPDVDEEISLRN